jgi:ferrous iron transport protein B
MSETAAVERSAASGPRALLIALAGQPNVGNSTVFNLLTGLSQHVGNWPGKTVGRRGRRPRARGGSMGLDWRLLVALVTSFVAKENAIATLAVLYGHDPSNSGFVETLTAQVAPASALAFLVVTMLFIPCAATVAVMRQETRRWRWTLFSVLLLLALAFAAGALVFQTARWLQVGL